jgi:hypothetical protein
MNEGVSLHRSGMAAISCPGCGSPSGPIRSRHAHQLTNWRRTRRPPAPTPMPCSASSGRHPPNSICPGRMEGAAFLCADLGITPETRDDHAAYIAHGPRS